MKSIYVQPLIMMILRDVLLRKYFHEILELIDFWDENRWV